MSLESEKSIDADYAILKSLDTKLKVFEFPYLDMLMDKRSLPE